MTAVERASLYIAKLPPSIQGSGGSSALFKAACVLVKGFALTADQAWPLITSWNQSHGAPPWSEAELRHKLASALSSNGPSGHLLNAQDARTVDASPVGHGAIFKPEKPQKQWPQFHPLDQNQIARIATLRGLPEASVVGGAKNGYLFGATIDGQASFVITEGAFAQARRFDGLPFPIAQGTPAKAKNLLGSRGAFIGQRWLGGPDVNVLLVEGVIGLIEGFAAHHLVDPPLGWTILAATSAGSRFSRDPDLLKKLAGRRVRIVPDRDEAGLDGAASWLVALEQAGCAVDALRLPDGIKDVGTLVANPEKDQATLKSLFE